MPGANHGDLEQLLPPDLRAFLRRNPLSLRHAIAGQRHGRHGSRRAGVGLDFLDHRAYVPGDDPRHLDWRALARRDRLMVRRTETEEDLDLVLVLDLSGGMAYPAADASTSKAALARTLAVALAWLAARGGDRIAAVAGTGGEVLAPLGRARGGMDQVRRLAAWLGPLQPAGACPWPELLTTAAARRDRHRVVVILSDLLDPSAGLPGADTAEDDLWRGLAHMARRDDVLAVATLHEDELTFPWDDRRPTRFEDLRGVRAPLEAAPDKLRAGYLRALAAHLDATAQRAADHRVRFEPAVAGRSLSASLVLQRLLARLAGDVFAPAQPWREAAGR